MAVEVQLLELPASLPPVVASVLLHPLAQIQATVVELLVEVPLVEVPPLKELPVVKLDVPPLTELTVVKREVPPLKELPVALDPLEVPPLKVLAEADPLEVPS